MCFLRKESACCYLRTCCSLSYRNSKALTRSFSDGKSVSLPSVDRLGLFLLLFCLRMDLTISFRFDERTWRWRDSILFCVQIKMWSVQELRTVFSFLFLPCNASYSHKKYANYAHCWERKNDFLKRRPVFGFLFLSRPILGPWAFGKTWWLALLWHLQQN